MFDIVNGRLTRPLLPRGDVILTVRPVISLSARNDARPRAFRWTVDGQVRPATPPEGETTPTAFEIKPSPVIEPDPGFFVGAGDGSNGYYAERPAR